jgi:hypothetical protein
MSGTAWRCGAGRERGQRDLIAMENAEIAEIQTSASYVIVIIRERCSCACDSAPIIVKNRKGLRSQQFNHWFNRETCHAIEMDRELKYKEMKNENTGICSAHRYR